MQDKKSQDNSTCYIKRKVLVAIIGVATLRYVFSETDTVSHSDCLLPGTAAQVQVLPGTAAQVQVPGREWGNLGRRNRLNQAL